MPPTPAGMVHHALALGDRELAEQEEGLARLVATQFGLPRPALERRRLRLRGRLGELDQFVLDLERAEGCETAYFAQVDGISIMFFMATNASVQCSHVRSAA